MSQSTLELVVRRTIRASPERIFEAWTRPEQLRAWWGPAGMTCDAAEVDLRIGGEYRLANKAADGSVVWIVGTFERIERPTELAYTWRLEPGPDRIERVTVSLRERGDQTEVIVTHERIVDARSKDAHQAGWHGCLDGLEQLFADPATD